MHYISIFFSLIYVSASPLDIIVNKL